MAARIVRSRISSALVALMVVCTMLLVGCDGGLEENATGQEIYEARCASCHRKDLSGGIGPALGPGSEAVDRPLDYYEITINTGKGRMPSFRSTLTEEQIARVIDYVLSVQNAG
jgi:mono/diheme cytochrome c family protein